MVLDLAGSGFGTHAIDLADLVPGIAAQDRRRVEAVLAHTERIEVASIAMAYQALHWLWRDLLHGVEPAWTLENLATSTARIRAWRDA
jgi:hypothetical protein